MERKKKAKAAALAAMLLAFGGIAVEVRAENVPALLCTDSKAAAVDENYTATELIPATIALRAEVFEGFTGTIQVLLEEKSGVQKTAELGPDNFYSWNLSVCSGTYRVKSAEARDAAGSFLVEYPGDFQTLAEKSLLVIKLAVRGETTDTEEISGVQDAGAADKAEETAGQEAESQTPLQTEVPATGENPEGEQQEKTGTQKTQETEEVGTMQRLRKGGLLVIISGIGVFCLAGWLMARRKRR